jgi:predicted transcriptional regulator
MPRRPALTRRERQIMDALYALGRATAQQVLDHVPDPPSYSAIRALLRILEDKGHVRHEADGPRYVYLPVVNARTAQKNAVAHLVRTFFSGSAERAVAALIESSDTKLSAAEIERLERLIASAREKGR